jgi:hypothetical protein
VGLPYQCSTGWGVAYKRDRNRKDSRRIGAKIKIMGKKRETFYYYGGSA